MPFLKTNRLFKQEFTMRYFACVMIILAVLPVYAEEKPQLPPRVETALQTFDNDLAAAAQAYLQAVERAQANAKRVLEREMQAATRRGDLESALAIREKIEEVEATVVRDLLGNPIISPEEQQRTAGFILVSSSWKCVKRNFPWTFKEDGTFERVGGAHPWNGGTWAALEDTQQFQLRWANGQDGGVFTYNQEKHQFESSLQTLIRQAQQ